MIGQGSRQMRSRSPAWLRDHGVRDDPMNLIRLTPAKGGSQAHRGTPFAGVLFSCNGRTQMRSLQINGQIRKFPPGGMPSTLLALLEALDLAATTIVAEVDGRIVPADEFAQTAISSGQTIELVKFMGGG